MKRITEANKKLSQANAQLTKGLKEWHTQLEQGTKGDWKTRFVNKGNTFASDQAHDFCVMCWKQAEIQNKRKDKSPIFFYIGPGRLNMIDEDKILVECRYSPKDTSTNAKNKE